MKRKQQIWAIVVAVVIAGGAFWGGMMYGQSMATPARSTTGAGATFTGRGGTGFTGGAGFGGGTAGTIIQTGTGSFTIQLPNSTSSNATTGTKLVLVDNATQVQELVTVPASNLKTGQNVSVTGVTNSDGSITAATVMVRPTTTRSQ